MSKHITAYDPTIKQRVLFLVKNNWAISVVTGYKFQYNKRETKKVRKVILAIVIISLFVLSGLVVLNGLIASAQSPSNVYAITLTTSSPSSGLVYQQLIYLNSSIVPGLNAQFSNIQFVYGNGTNIYAWIQSIGSTTATIWLKLYSDVDQTIYLDVYPSTDSFFSGTTSYLGEAPTLSPSYAEYDNGAMVFNWYMSFGGRSSIPSVFSQLDNSNNDWITVSGTTFNYYSTYMELRPNTNGVAGWYGLVSNSLPFTNNANPNVLDFAVDLGSGGTHPTAVGIGANNIVGEPGGQEMPSFDTNGYFVYYPGSGNVQVATAGSGNFYTTSFSNPANVMTLYSLAYNSQGILSVSINNNPVFSTTSASSNVNQLYELITKQSSNGNLKLYWLDSRTYPSGGIMPTASFSIGSSGPSTYTITFTESGLPTSTKWYLNISGQSSLSSTTRSISVNLLNGTYSYTLGSGNPSYAASPSSFQVAGAPLSESITFNAAYSVTFTESGLPTNTEWYLNISGQSSLSSTSTTISINLEANSYSYTVATGNKQYAPSPSSGSFTVTSTTLSESVTFSLVTYTATFTESGLTANHEWYVNITGQSSLSTVSTSQHITLPNGTYSFTIASNDSSLFPNPPSGQFTINGASYSLSVTFGAKSYAVTFSTSILPNGNKWYVNVTSGPSLYSVVPSFTYYFTNGTYNYTVASQNKIYYPDNSIGTFTVNGATVSITLAFTEQLYNLTFTEQNLGQGIMWYVNLTGEPSLGTMSTSVNIQLPNGSYFFDVAVNNPHYNISTISYAVTISGASVTQVIYFNYSNIYYVYLTFIESGYTGKWSMNVNGVNYVSTTNTIVAKVLAGDIQYQVWGISGYSINPIFADNTFLNSATIHIVFTPQAPNSLSWFLNIDFLIFIVVAIMSIALALWGWSTLRRRS